MGLKPSIGTLIFISSSLIFYLGCEDAPLSPSFDYRAHLASQIVEAPGNTNESPTNGDHLIDGIHGAGFHAGNTEDVFSLGYDTNENNYVVLSWNDKVVLNGEGTDFVIFENPFQISGGPSHFMDPAIVYLSVDGINWTRFPFDYTADDETEYSSDPDHWQGFAGIQPVLLNEETNPVDPFVFSDAGGDHFDLDRLGDEGDEGYIKQNGFRYLKIVTAPTIVNPDTGEPFVKDPISNGCDIDGVLARYISE